MDEMEKLLSAYGIDWNAISDRFGGNKGLYKKCLVMFASDKNFDELGKSLAEKNIDLAFRAAHTIKGMASNMGFDRMTDVVSLIVEPLRAGETSVDYTALYEGLGKEISLIYELISKAENL